MILSFLFGGMLFFTIVVGPVLFSTFDSKTAGHVMNAIFPYYFKLQWIGGVFLYSLFGLFSFINKENSKDMKISLLLLSLLVVIGMALDRALYPVAKSLILEYYELVDLNHLEEANIIKSRFDKFHRITSILNMINIIIITGLIFISFRFRINKPKN